MIFKDKKENLIKVFEVEKETKIAYIINTLLHVINRWDKIRIYIYNIGNEENEKEKETI